jgi:Lon protease-like protein
LASLRLFFKVHGISADWDAIIETPDERLITSLAMICPFEPCEKQALLEADDLCERSRVLTALIEMAVIDPSTDGDSVRH